MSDQTDMIDQPGMTDQPGMINQSDTINQSNTINQPDAINCGITEDEYTIEEQYTAEDLKKMSYSMHIDEEQSRQMRVSETNNISPTPCTDEAIMLVRTTSSKAPNFSDDTCEGQILINCTDTNTDKCKISNLTAEEMFGNDITDDQSEDSTESGTDEKSGKNKKEPLKKTSDSDDDASFDVDDIVRNITLTDKSLKSTTPGPLNSLNTLGSFSSFDTIRSVISFASNKLEGTNANNNSREEKKSDDNDKISIDAFIDIDDTPNECSITDSKINHDNVFESIRSAVSNDYDTLPENNGLLQKDDYNEVSESMLAQRIFRDDSDVGTNTEKVNNECTKPVSQIVSIFPIAPIKSENPVRHTPIKSLADSTTSGSFNLLSSIFSSRTQTSNKSNTSGLIDIVPIKPTTMSSTMASSSTTTKNTPYETKKEQNLNLDISDEKIELNDLDEDVLEPGGKKETTKNRSESFGSLGSSSTAGYGISLQPDIGLEKKTTDKLRKFNIESRRVYKWVDDNSVTRCFHCNKKFSSVLRKHHCRLCGRIFCYDCSDYSTKLPLDILNKIPKRPQSFSDFFFGDDFSKTVRVCGNCYAHASKLSQIKKIIKVFDVCQFTIKDLYVLGNLNPEWDDASKFLLAKFREIQYKLSIDELTPAEKRLLWVNRNYLTGHSRWMVQLVKATDFSNQKAVFVLEQLMYKKKVNVCWDTMCSRFCSETVGITDMLDLIGYNRNNPIISNFIMKCLNEVEVDTLKNYLSFLVCNIENNKFMINIFLEKGIQNFKFMSNLYWCVKVFCGDIECRKEYITQILTTIQARCDKDFRHRFKEMIKRDKLDIKWISLLNNQKKIVLPVCSEKVFKSVDDKNVKTMDSYSQPVIVQFIDEAGVKKPIMFKYDDVRKDYIILNIINVVHDILKREEKNLDIEMVRYEVMPTSRNTGYIEIVENASTVYDIVENKGQSIQNFILNHNKNMLVSTFREKFIKSTALCCVVSYLLGIGDRHLDNIMISKNGLLFHIDFGFVLGQDPKYSNNRSIRIIPEIVNVMGGYGSADYEYFKQVCVKIYNRLRLHVNLFSNLLSIIPSIDPSITIDVIKRELMERFEIGENCIEAATHMDTKVDTKNNIEYMVIDWLYKAKKSTLAEGVNYVKKSITNLLGPRNYSD